MPGLEDSRDSNVFVSYLTPEQTAILVMLVGEKCQVTCTLDGKETEILWDTGARVSIITKRMLQEQFPDIFIKGIGEILEVGSDQKLEVANGTQIP